MTESNRFEIKIPIPLNRYEEVETWLRIHPLLFKHHYPKRWVNSLYLDLPNLSSYEENLSGISQRKKVRIRWYNALENADRATLEFKHRRAGKGHKISFNTHLDLSVNDFCWYKALSDCYQGLSTSGKALWGGEQVAVLICRYMRRYYLSACGKIRATFDEHMQVFDQRFQSHANLHKSVGMGEYMLLELKCDEQYEKELSALLATCPLRPSRHSKYVNGVRHLTWT